MGVSASPKVSVAGRPGDDRLQIKPKLDEQGTSQTTHLVKTAVWSFRQEPRIIRAHESPAAQLIIVFKSKTFINEYIDYHISAFMLEISLISVGDKPAQQGSPLWAVSLLWSSAEKHPANSRIKAPSSHPVRASNIISGPVCKIHSQTGTFSLIFMKDQQV